jgi:putative aldouronate transport system permease protein
MAALSSVDPELHQAAIVDGANKFQRIIHIDVPAIMPVMVILLILNTGNILSVGFEKSYLLINDLNNQVAEVISTYSYTVGIIRQMYSYSSAIGLFNNSINFIILIIVNRTARMLSDTSLW